MHPSPFWKIDVAELIKKSTPHPGPPTAGSDSGENIFSGPPSKSNRAKNLH
jgi:hypothetical protein